MESREQIDERNERRHASHPEQWGWANTPDCSVIGKGHVRTLIEEIESQAATIARLTAERDEMIRDMADAVRSACDGDIGEVEKTLVPWCSHIIVARDTAAREQLNRDLANAALDAREKEDSNG